MIMLRARTHEDAHVPYTSQRIASATHTHNKVSAEFAGIRTPLNCALIYAYDPRQSGGNVMMAEAEVELKA